MTALPHQMRSTGGRWRNALVSEQALRQASDHHGNIQDRADQFDGDHLLRSPSHIDRHLLRNKVDADGAVQKLDPSDTFHIDFWDLDQLDQSGDRLDDPRTHDVFPFFYTGKAYAYVHYRTKSLRSGYAAPEPFCGTNLSSSRNKERLTSRTCDLGLWITGKTGTITIDAGKSGVAAPCR